MPDFPNNPLELLKRDRAAADQTIDLGSNDAEQALATVARLIDTASPGKRFSLRFPPAKGDGSETLFQPLGRFLLARRRAGALASVMPESDGAGYSIEIAGLAK